MIHNKKFVSLDQVFHSPGIVSFIHLSFIHLFLNFVVDSKEFIARELRFNLFRTSVAQWLGAGLQGNRSSD